MDELEQMMNSPSVLAQLDQVMAVHKERTGKPCNMMQGFGWWWRQCDKGHWHKVEECTDGR